MPLRSRQLLLISFVFLGFALFFFLLPSDVLAQESKGLVPCDGVDTQCQVCHVVELGQNLINFLIYLSVFIAVMLFVYAGVLMVTAAGDVGQVTRAKGVFSRVGIGMILVLVAWLLIDTVMFWLFQPGNFDVIQGTKKFGPWNELECVAQISPIEPDWSVREGVNAYDPIAAAAGSGAGAVPAPIPEGTYSHAEAAALLGSNFTISASGGCNDRTRSNCTSLDGVRPTTINRIVSLQTSVGIPLVITGGTEDGHSGGLTGSGTTHGNGYKIDLRTTTALNNYITSNYTSLGGNKWQDPQGNIYWRHGPVDHWDVTITR